MTAGTMGKAFLKREVPHDFFISLILLISLCVLVREFLNGYGGIFVISFYRPELAGYCSKEDSV